MITDTLPDTLAGLLEVAIRDLKAVEGNPDYNVYMGFYHETFGNGKCNVCLAGACLVQMGLPKHVNYEINETSRLDKKLQAINSLRGGYIRLAYRHLYGTNKDDLQRIDVEFYQLNRNKFYEDLEKVLEYLKKEAI